MRQNREANTLAVSSTAARIFLLLPNQSDVLLQGPCWGAETQSSPHSDLTVMKRCSKINPEAYDQKMDKGWQTDLVGKDVFHSKTVV